MVDYRGYISDSSSNLVRNLKSILRCREFFVGGEGRVLGRGGKNLEE